MTDSDELDTPAKTKARQPKSEPAEQPLIAFTYPTLGVTLWAKDQEDADAQAAAHPLNPKNA